MSERGFLKPLLRTVFQSLRRYEPDQVQRVAALRERLLPLSPLSGLPSKHTCICARTRLQVKKAGIKDAIIKPAMVQLKTRNRSGEVSQRLIVTPN